jgi:hypothetical protein
MHDMNNIKFFKIRNYHVKEVKKTKRKLFSAEFNRELRDRNQPLF